MINKQLKFPFNSLILIMISCFRMVKMNQNMLENYLLVAWIIELQMIL